MLAARTADECDPWTLRLETVSARRWAAATGSSWACSGPTAPPGRAVTTVPERWSGSWPDCVRLAQMADRVGIEFMLPIGRWKGYGGDTDYQGATWETVAWACGLLAKTERLTVFGTVHAPLIPPLIAAKEFVTADHIGEGRFGLNVVCGWNDGEFEMFGATLRDHGVRYEYAQEWLDIIKLAWSPHEGSGIISAMATPGGRRQRGPGRCCPARCPRPRRPFHTS